MKTVIVVALVAIVVLLSVISAQVGTVSGQAALPAASSPTLVAGMVGAQRYIDPNGIFTLTVPAGWKTPQPNTTLVYQFDDQPFAMATITIDTATHFYQRDASQISSDYLKRFFELRIKDTLAHYGGLMKIQASEVQPVKLGSLEGYGYHLSETSDHTTEYDVRAATLLDGRIVEFDTQAPGANWKEAQPILDAMAASLVVTPLLPTQTPMSMGDLRNTQTAQQAALTATALAPTPTNTSTPLLMTVAMNTLQVQQTRAVTETEVYVNTAPGYGIAADRLWQENGPRRAIPEALLGIRSLQNGYDPHGESVLMQLMQTVFRQDDKHVTYGDGGQQVDNLAFSPDGKKFLTGTLEGVATLWDVQSGQPIFRLRSNADEVPGVAFSPDGQILATSDISGAYVWDASTGKLLHSIPSNQKTINTVEFSPDGKTLLFSSDDGTARLWDWSNEKEIQVFSGHQDTVLNAIFSPDGKMILTASLDHTARLWDAATGQVLRTFSGHNDGLAGIAFSPDGRMVLTGSFDKMVRLWNVASGQLVRTFTGHADKVTKVAFAPDGKTIASTGLDKTVRLWDVASGKLLHIFDDGMQEGFAVKFSPDGKYLLAGSKDYITRLWDLSTSRIYRIFMTNRYDFYAAAVSADDKTIISVNRHFIWQTDAQTGATSRLDAIPDSFDASFSPDSSTLFLGHSDGTVELRDVATGRSLHTFSKTGPEAEVVGFSRDGKTILSSDDNGLHVWSVMTDASIIDIPMKDGEFAAAISPDGRQVVASDNSLGNVTLWDVATGQEISTFNPTGGQVQSVRFSTDGKNVITASSSVVQYWDAATGKLLFDNKAVPLTGIFSPDGKYILVQNGSFAGLYTDFPQFHHVVRSFIGSGLGRSVFSPDGRYLLTWNKSVMHLWEINYHDLASYVCNFVPRDFTSEERSEFGITDTTPTCPKFGADIATPTPIPTPQLTPPIPVWTPIATPTP